MRDKTKERKPRKRKRQWDKQGRRNKNSKSKRTESTLDSDGSEEEDRRKTDGGREETEGKRAEIVRLLAPDLVFYAPETPPGGNLRCSRRGTSNISGWPGITVTSTSAECKHAKTGECLIAE